MREEGAVGGSVAGSTACWWPSDRDRFPPRFLLPPSLQTHNCIISTHLASSPLLPFPWHHPRSPSAPSVLLASLAPSSFLLLLPSFDNPPLRLSLQVRSCARLCACLSLISRSSEQPTGCISVSRCLCCSDRHHPPRLLFSFARKRCHTRETAHRLFIPAPLPSTAPTDAPLSLARASFCHSRSPRGPSLLQCSLCSSFSPREAEVMPRIRFFILPPPLPPLLLLLFLSVHLVVRSVIGPAVPTDGHATIYPTRRRGQSAGRKDGA